MRAFDAELRWVLDRAAQLRKDADALEAELRTDSGLLCPVWRDQSLVADDRLQLLPLAAAGDLLAVDGELVWLGRLGAAGCFALDVSALADPASHPLLAGRGEWTDLRQALALLPADHAGLAAYARGILYWHRRARYCSVCGAPTGAREGGHVRVCRADGCQTQFFPRTDPAVIMLVRDGDRCLLGRQASWPRGMYSTLAGFVEPGETLEQAVAREVLEEAGVAVDDMHYFRSQPWPFPSSLMVGFFARARSFEIQPSDELEHARWFGRDELRDQRARGFFTPGRFTLSGQLIEAFLAEA